MFIKRQLIILCLFTLALICIVGRLLYIQVIGTESFSKYHINLIKKAVQQRQQQVVLHSGRGEITDRYGQSLTGNRTHAMVAFPFLDIAEQAKELQEIANLVGLSHREWTEYLDGIKEPTVLKRNGQIIELTEQEADLINQFGVSGLLGVPYEMRYKPSETVAQHLIGYIGQNPNLIRTLYAEDLAQGRLRENSEIGIMGLEKTFQPFLQGNGPTTLSYYVDARGVPLRGMEMKYLSQENPFYPLEVQTTLDKEIQEHVENVMDRHQILHGAAVVLDAETSELLAMSSRPSFLGNFSTFSTWENKALKRYNPGSVFKIVIAAAALEEGIVKPQQRFQCDGVLEGTDFHCWNLEGHGNISFEEGFAQSCNIVFGTLAQMLGPDKIEEYARKLGLLELNGWRTASLFSFENFHQFDHEEAGQVFSPYRLEEEKQDFSYLRQTGIGQLDVQASPLAVANMLATVAKGGAKHQVNAVREILYQTGGSFYHFKRQTLSDSRISPYTAYRLQHLLAGVVEKGTAKQIKNPNWSAGGKTGTAQVYSPTEEKIDKNHQWFAGYYPQNHPRFIIVVLNLNQPLNSSNRSILAFADIVEWLDQNR